MTLCFVFKPCSQKKDRTLTEGKLAYKKGGRTKRAQVVDYDDVKNMSTVTPRKSVRKSTQKTTSSKTSTKQKRKAPAKEEEKASHSSQQQSHREERKESSSGESSYSRRRKKQRQEEANEESEQSSPPILSPQPHKRTFKYPSLSFSMDESMIREDLDCKELVSRLVNSICEAEKEGLEASIQLPRGKDYILPFLTQILEDFPALLEEDFPSNLQAKDEVDRETESSLEGLGEQLQELEQEIERCRNLLTSSSSSSSSSLIPAAFQLPTDHLDSPQDENTSPLHNKTEAYLTTLQGLVSSVKTSAQQMEHCQEGIQKLIADAGIRQSELYDASKEVMTMSVPSSSSSSSSTSSSGTPSEGNPAKLIAKLSKRKRK